MAEGLSGAATQIRAVLYTDQVGSTSMAQALGDLAFDEVRAGIERCIRAAVSRHDGELIKLTGDGGLAVFASASDAVAGSVTLQREIELLPARGEHVARMRVGLSVGDVVLQAGDCHGTPVVEAARLEAAAPSGGILCTRLVKDLAGSRTEYEFRSHDAIEAKGIPEPIEVWEVPWNEVDATGGFLPDSLARTERFAFVGRATELEALQTAVRRAASGEPTMVLVGGEPGAGKSRLVREAARHAAASGTIVLHGRCDDGTGRPYQPFAEALSTFVRKVPEGPTRLGPTARELGLLLPELPSIVPDLSAPTEADADTMRFRLFEATASWLQAVAAEQPVMLVLDDLHWADQGTAQLLAHLVTSLGSARLLIAVTYRNTETSTDIDMPQLVSKLRRAERVTILPLDGLDHRALGELLAGAGISASDGDVRSLLERTGGNAFFTIEVLAGLEPGRRGLGSIDQVTDAVRDVVVARVEQLSERAQQLLTTASVFGRLVSLEQVATALDIDRLAVAELADEAVEAGILVEVDDPPLHVQFSHALVRTSLYGEMKAMRRSVLHAKAAEAIQAHAADRLDDVADQVAGHLARTGSRDDLRAAVDWYRRAARQAIAQAAEAAASDHYRKALAVLDLPGAPDDARLRCTLHVELGDALRKARLEGSRAHLLEAAALARAHGFDDLLVSAATSNTRGFFSSAGATDHERVTLLRDALEVVEEPIVRARLLSNLSVELTFDVPIGERIALSDAAVAIASAHGADEHLFHVLGQRYGTLWTAGTLHDRRTLVDDLRALADQLDRPELRYVAAWTGFQTAMELGDFPLADECLTIQEDISAEVPTQWSYLRIRQALRAIVRGELDEAETMVGEAFDAAAIAGEPDAYTFYVGQLVSVRYHQGRLDELLPTLEMLAEAAPGLPSLTCAVGLAHLEAGRMLDVERQVALLAPQLDTFGDDLNWLITVGLLAELAAGVADRPLCSRLHTVLAPHRQQYIDNATNWFGAVSRHLGLLEHALGRFEDADASFADALARHEALPAPLLAARSRLDWAGSLVDRPYPQTDPARALLEEARDAAARFGMASVDRRASALLDTIDQGVPR